MNIIRNSVCLVVFVCVYVSISDAQPKLVGGGKAGSGRAMFRSADGEDQAICDSNPQLGGWPTVLCKQLGYPGAGEVQPISQSILDPSTATIAFTNPDNCDDTIESCTSNGGCDNSDEVYIRCEDNIRNGFPASNSFMRPEVYRNGEWAVVCDGDLSDTNKWAGVYCKQMGFRSTGYLVGTTRSNLDMPSRKFNCGASASNMGDCSSPASCPDNQQDTMVKCAKLRKKASVYMFFDVSGSMEPIITPNMEQHFLPQQTEFLQKFFDFTSSDAHFEKYEVKLVAVPFNNKLFTDEKWVLDFSTYSSALELRNAQDIGLDLFKDGIEGRDPDGKTNIGAVLAEIKQKYADADVVIMISDFVNMFHSPKPVDELKWFNTNGVHVVPVLLNSPHSDHVLYHKMRYSVLNMLGFDVAQGISEQQFQELFDSALP